ncbi:hypothetical protein ACQVP2_27455 [Methylobacterium aquaticum]|uniref:hypothetical protein n=1 Tax=Methylobacterium aquaticum TaxID=270351 RepID=UPI003D182CC6
MSADRDFSIEAIEARLFERGQPHMPQIRRAIAEEIAAVAASRANESDHLTPKQAREIFNFHTDPHPHNDEWTKLVFEYLKVPSDQRDVMFLVLAGEFCFIRESWRKLDAQARATCSQTPETGSPDTSPPELSRVRAGLVRMAEAFLKAVKPQSGN